MGFDICASRRWRNWVGSQSVGLVQASGPASDQNSLSDPEQVFLALWPSVFTSVKWS